MILEDDKIQSVRSDQSSEVVQARARGATEIDVENGIKLWVY